MRSFWLLRQQILILYIVYDGILQLCKYELQVKIQAYVFVCNLIVGHHLKASDYKTGHFQMVQGLLFLLDFSSKTKCPLQCAQFFIHLRMFVHEVQKDAPKENSSKQFTLGQAVKAAYERTAAKQILGSDCGDWCFRISLSTSLITRPAPFGGCTTGRDVMDICGRRSALGALSTPSILVLSTRPTSTNFSKSCSSSLTSTLHLLTHSTETHSHTYCPFLSPPSVFFIASIFHLQWFPFSYTHLQSIRKTCCLHIWTIARNLPHLNTSFVITLACANTTYLN